MHRLLKIVYFELLKTEMNGYIVLLYYGNFSFYE